MVDINHIINILNSQLGTTVDIGRLTCILQSMDPNLLNNMFYSMNPTQFAHMFQCMDLSNLSIIVPKIRQVKH